MLPVRGDVPARTAPFVVVALIAANVGVFAHEIALALGGGTDAGELADFVERWGFVPREFLRELADPGAASARVWCTPLTAMFVHGGLAHLLGNLLYLWIFGIRVEDLLGHRRFAVFYLACGLAAAAIQMASAPDSYAPTVGASGAISGVLGAYAVAYPRGRLRMLWPPVRVPAAAFLLLWIALQVASGLDAWGEPGAGIAWWAHVGGFAAGMALGRSMWVRKPARARVRI
jgi:membrane associated rhomboid family serine protease